MKKQMTLHSELAEATPQGQVGQGSFPKLLKAKSQNVALLISVMSGAQTQ